MINVIKAYAMYAQNEILQKRSSSGGVFSLLAKDVIKKDGVVFGAAFCDDFKAVKHIPVTNSNDLWKLQGSKYLRSDVSASFSAVSELLETGKDVLFSGTPCQISALKKYLKKDYDNLLTIAVICHGTPKSAVWKDYVTELETKYRSNVTAVSFRDKDGKQVGKYRLRVQFANGKQYCKTKDRDVYMCGFLQNIILEKSCFNCHFKGNNIESDVILGDFWGAERVAPELRSQNGTSLVIVRSEKGQMAVKAVLPYTRHTEVDINLAVIGNSSLLCSAKKPADYEVFFHSYHSNRCANSIKKYLSRKNYFLLLKNKLTRLIPKRNHLK